SLDSAGQFSLPSLLVLCCLAQAYCCSFHPIGMNSLLSRGFLWSCFWLPYSTLSGQSCQNGFLHLPWPCMVWALPSWVLGYFLRHKFLTCKNTGREALCCGPSAHGSHGG